MKLLIVYGTTEGQTRRICEFLSDTATESGHEVTLMDATGCQHHPSNFDATIIGASLHAEQYQASIQNYIQKHHKTLNSINSVFVSVSLTAASNEPESWKELKKITKKFLMENGWQPTFVEQVAGALRYTKYNFFKKFIMRMIAQKQGGDTNTSTDHEYTDWNQVEKIIPKLEKAFGKSINNVNKNESHSP